MTASSQKRSVVVIDMGGVLIRWDPTLLYRKFFKDDVAGMQHFLTHVCSPAWNDVYDAGRPFAEGVRELTALYPDKEEMIRAYVDRYEEMIPGADDEAVGILRELKAKKTPLYSVTNWSSETWVLQVERFDFIALFDGIVVSGDEKLMKPDPRIYQCLIDRYGVDPKTAVFIDDLPGNVESAANLGFHGIRYTDASSLRKELTAVGLL